MNNSYSSQLQSLHTNENANNKCNHPNYPDCETGILCDNCDAIDNPVLIVACNLVSFSEMPLGGGAISNSAYIFDFKVLLEVPFEGNIMDTNLHTNGNLPTNQPYNTAP